jgi:aromatic ring-opening dioxygenase catalytic subunit (LigB family)
MAEIVGAFASSHAPLMARAWQSVGPERLASIEKTFAEMGRRFEKANPDVLVVLTPDHWVNFFINNMPSVCIGVGETHDGPPEPWMKGMPWPSPWPGDPEFGLYLAERAFAEGFEPTLSYHLEMDHGVAIPLWRMGVKKLPAIVPFVINTVEPPLISVKRCIDWGAWLRESIEKYPKKLRVAIMATGGLSHSIGEHDMGRIDEPFDMACLEQLRSGNIPKLVDFLDKNIESGGNGAAEIRNWVIAHKVVEGKGFDLIGYHPYPEWYVGCAFATWGLGAAS